MEKSIYLAFLVFVAGHSVAGQEIRALSELPLGELLAQKKIVEEGEGLPVAAAVVGPPPAGDVHLKGLHRLPDRRTFHDDDDDDDKGHLHKKKEEHQMHDILNTSIMVLSYLAFGGYLLCMIATALREKRRRFPMSYPPVAAVNNHFAQVLQHHLTHRPARPFIRFPTVTVHQGGKKRRRRSSQREAPWGEAKERPPLFNIIDYIEILAHGGD